MSSILDALNKLEQEKAQSRRERDAAADPVSAAHDLVGRSVLRDRVTVRVSPVAIIVSSVILFILVIALAVVVARSMVRPDDPGTLADAPLGADSVGAAAAQSSPAPAATIPPLAQRTTSEFVRLPAPEPTPMPQQVQAAPPTVSRAPEPQPEPPPAAAPAPVRTDLPASSAPNTNAVAQAPVMPRPESTQSQTPPPASAPQPEPDPVVTSEATAEPTRPTRLARTSEDLASRSNRPLPAADAAATRPAREEDLDVLPVLTDADVTRAGLVQLKINMPSPSGPANPQGSAILTVREEAENGSVITNTMKFYEGQRIQTTTLRLFKVERNAVGIEDMRTGQKYRLPF